MRVLEPPGHVIDIEVSDVSITGQTKKIQGPDSNVIPLVFHGKLSAPPNLCAIWIIRILQGIRPV
jgi:hypothetical protein